jgi:hypothetical protein
MKRFRNYVAICLVLITMTGCKKENTAGKPGESGEVAEAPVQVVVEMVVKKDDYFQLFYTEDGTTDFKEEKSVWIAVPGKNESQPIIFNLPDIHIGNMRLDPGHNPAQDEMTVNKIIIKEHDEEMEINETEFFTYFNYGAQIKRYPQGLSFKGVTINGVHDPFFYGNAMLTQALKELDQ